MAEMLLINPRKRTRRHAAKKTAARRRHNPVTKLVHFAPKPKRRVRARRHNPIGLKRLHARRRRNPIGLGGANIGAMLKNAALGGAGAVAVDVLMGQLDSFLPASMHRTPGTLGVGDAVKIGITIAAGQLLKKPTKGLSVKMAEGSLIVQARDIIASFVPATMPLGYSSPGRIIQGTQRVGPIMNRMAAYQAPGTASPMLSAYQRPGMGSMLSAARQREAGPVR